MNTQLQVYISIFTWLAKSQTVFEWHSEHVIAMLLEAWIITNIHDLQNFWGMIQSFPVAKLPCMHISYMYYSICNIVAKHFKVLQVMLMRHKIIHI